MNNNKNYIVNFCKYCGAEIPKNDTHCPMCHKRLKFSIYLSSKTKSIVMKISIFLNVTLLFSVFSLYNPNNSLLKFGEKNKLEYTTLKLENKELYKYFNEILEYAEYVDAGLAVYQISTVAITPSGDRYHTLDCQYVKNAEWIAVPRSMAEKEYIPCNTCGKGIYRNFKFSDDFKKNANKYFDKKYLIVANK